MYYSDKQEETNRKNLLEALANETLTFSNNRFGVKRVVLAEGNVMSNSLIIGEALGREEDECGRIFIGRSGQLVRKMLRSAGLEGKVVFSNVIPWRPANNRTPMASEIKLMSFALKEIIRILNVENIICLGAVSKAYILQNKNISQNSEKYFTYHPSFFLRNSSSAVAEDIYTTILSFSRNVKDCEKSFQVFKQDLQ